MKITDYEQQIPVINERPKIIRSYDDAYMFYCWLHDNFESFDLQGYHFDCRGCGYMKVIYAGFTGNADIYWIFEHRKILNDWITSRIDIIDCICSAND